MNSVHLPSPIVAAVGLAAVTADGVRRLPGLVPAVAHAAWDRYGELAQHGQDVLSGRRPGTGQAALDELMEKVEAIDVAGAVDAEPVEPAELVEEPVTAPPAPAPPIGLTEPVELPEDLLEDVAQLTPGDELPHSELPLPDFDHLTVPQLRGRLRTLGLPQLVQLRDYEQAHGHRLPVLTLLDNRVAKLLADDPQ